MSAPSSWKTSWTPKRPWGTAQELAQRVEEFVPIARAILGLQGLKIIAFGPETPETLIADWFTGPIMYVAAAEGDGDLHDGRGDAYCGLLNCSYNLGLRGAKAYIPEAPVGTAQELAVPPKSWPSGWRSLCPLPGPFWACRV